MARWLRGIFAHNGGFYWREFPDGNAGEVEAAALRDEWRITNDNGDIAYMLQRVQWGERYPIPGRPDNPNVQERPSRWERRTDARFKFRVEGTLYVPFKPLPIQPETIAFIARTSSRNDFRLTWRYATDEVPESIEPQELPGEQGFQRLQLRYAGGGDDWHVYILPVTARTYNIPALTVVCGPSTYRVPEELRGNYPTAYAEGNPPTWYVALYANDEPGLVWVPEKSAHWNTVEIKLDYVAPLDKVLEVGNGIRHSIGYLVPPCNESEHVPELPPSEPNTGTDTSDVDATFIPALGLAILALLAILFAPAEVAIAILLAALAAVAACLVPLLENDPGVQAFINTITEQGRALEQAATPEGLNAVKTSIQETMRDIANRFDVTGLM